MSLLALVSPYKKLLPLTFTTIEEALALRLPLRHIPDNQPPFLPPLFIFHILIINVSELSFISSHHGLCEPIAHARLCQHAARRPALHSLFQCYLRMPCLSFALIGILRRGISFPPLAHIAIWLAIPCDIFHARFNCTANVVYKCRRRVSGSDVDEPAARVLAMTQHPVVAKSIFVSLDVRR